MDRPRITTAQFYLVLVSWLALWCRFTQGFQQLPTLPTHKLQGSNSRIQHLSPRAFTPQSLVSGSINTIRQVTRASYEERKDLIQDELYRTIGTGLGEERYSPLEWLFALRTLPKSAILYRMRSQMLFNVVWTTLVCVLHHFRPLPRFPALPHTLLSSALGLLLVFRTNSAYQRFWESRQFWQQITNNSRNLAVKLACYLPQDYHFDFCALMISLPVALKNHLQGKSEDTSRFRKLFTLLGDDLDIALDKAHNKPLFICKTLSNKINVAFKNEMAQKQILVDSYLGQILFLIGACERIVTTPIPMTYSRHTTRLLAIFILTLPLVLVQDLGFLMVPVMLVFSWGMLAINEIGQFIEEPFNQGQHQLPLEQLIIDANRDVASIFDVALEQVDVSDPEQMEQELKSGGELLPAALRKFSRRRRRYVRTGATLGDAEGHQLIR